LDEEVPIEWLARFLELIHDTPNLTWLLLTKRPENWRKRISAAISHCEDATAEWLEEWTDCIDIPERGVFPGNVWVGASAENQSFADQRMQHLLRIPAVGRFLSIEPMIGPVDYLRSLAVSPITKSGDIVSQLIHWVIVGGESGSGSRPCNVEWVRAVVKQCGDADVPCFVKQLGASPGFSAPARIQDWDQWHINEGAWISKIQHPKGGDPEEWAEELRVRQFPEGLR
jgi:protein gp37